MEVPRTPPALAAVAVAVVLVGGFCLGVVLVALASTLSSALPS